MNVSKRLVKSGLLLAVLTAALTACSSGDLAFSNEGSEDVTVSTGDREFTVTADGGVILLDFGCSPGGIDVEFPSGDTVVVAGPVCPEEQVLIRDGRVDLQPQEKK